MRNLGLVIAAGALLGACATTRSTDLVRSDCEADVGSDARCVQLLTAPAGGYESEAEVRKAEEARVAGAFQSRLARMRAAHEQREAAARVNPPVRTATVAAPGGPRGLPEATPSAKDDADLEQELALVIREEKLDTGSSLRAIVKAPPVPQPKRAPIPIKTAPQSFGPTPEQWLRAAKCVVAAGRPKIRAAVEAAQKAGDRAAAGGLALLLVESDSLLVRVDQEVGHRKLANPGPVCSSSKLQSASDHLRTMLGAAPSARDSADRYARGLERVAETLEIRAGLPRGR